MPRPSGGRRACIKWPRAGTPRAIGACRLTSFAVSASPQQSGLDIERLCPSPDAFQASMRAPTLPPPIDDVSRRSSWGLRRCRLWIASHHLAWNYLPKGTNAISHPYYAWWKQMKVIKFFSEQMWQWYFQIMFGSFNAIFQKSWSFDTIQPIFPNGPPRLARQIFSTWARGAWGGKVLEENKWAFNCFEHMWYLVLNGYFSFDHQLSKIILWNNIHKTLLT